ncbi:MAG TPA: DUF4242 domain-containing protein [Polyangia bacterium]|jgi:hypothetical protein|nr:DUF4242 domain-containing protein [Polyangia bacterium]
MANFRSTILGAFGLTALVAAACSQTANKPPAQTGQLYMDVHELGAGKVTADAVAKAHAADLGAQGRHGVEFLHYWVDEQRGTVYCLSRAHDADAVVATHREAHGLIPTSIGVVSDGQ